MDLIGPFTYNAARFAFGIILLLPVRALLRKRSQQELLDKLNLLKGVSTFTWPAIAGSILFAAATLQQVGLVTTTAGNAGFISSLYVVLVPIMGIFFGKKTGLATWLGALVAVVGLYILSIGAGFTMALGDIYELIGALFWTAHILVVSKIANRINALDLAIRQFATCAILSAVSALIFEPISINAIASAALPIAYSGFFSIFAAFTLQIIAQKYAHPARASIFFSMESLFAAICGVIFLSEPVTTRLLWGGLLMFAGMIIAQREHAQVIENKVIAAPHSS
jgi:drug/metabolite transporter (DMT)-like permease